MIDVATIPNSSTFENMKTVFRENSRELFEREILKRLSEKYEITRAIDSKDINEGFINKNFYLINGVPFRIDAAWSYDKVEVEDEPRWLEYIDNMSKEQKHAVQHHHFKPSKNLAHFTQQLDEFFEKHPVYANKKLFKANDTSGVFEVKTFENRKNSDKLDAPKL